MKNEICLCLCFSVMLYFNMGVFTNDHNSLSNDFFTNLLDMSVDWKKSDNGQYLGSNKSSGKY